MKNRSARMIVVAALVMSLCPLLAYADDGQGQSGESSNPLTELLYMVVGLDKSGSEAVETQSSGELYQNDLSTSGIAVSAENLNGGLLVGAGGSLYYFPEVKSESSSDALFTYQDVYRYNVSGGTWQAISGLPAQVKWCSVAVFDGKLIVCAASLDESTEYVYSYDTKVEEGSRYWDTIAATGVPVGAGIVNNGGLLEVAGGLSGGSPSTAIYVYETSSGASGSVGQLAVGAIAPKMVPYSDTVYAYSWGNTLEEVRTGTGAAVFQHIDVGSSTNLTSALPLLEPVDAITEYPSTQSVTFGGISSHGVNGVSLAGPLANGSSADTYLKEWDVETFVPYSLRASNSRLFGAASCVYLGKLYTLGAIMDDAGNASLTGRSTAYADAELLSGNNGVWRQGSEQPLTFTCSPDFGRFADVVKVDDSVLSVGADYSASTGSTVITLQSSLLDRLGLGSHTVTMLFDDELTTVSGTFTVETAADSIADGYTKPTSLAMTGDAVPVVPIVAICVIAIGVVVFIAVRRKSPKM